MSIPKWKLSPNRISTELSQIAFPIIAENDTSFLVKLSARVFINVK